MNGLDIYILVTNNGTNKKLHYEHLPDNGLGTLMGRIIACYKMRVYRRDINGVDSLLALQYATLMGFLRAIGKPLWYQCGPCCFNSSPPGQNDRHYADDIFEGIFPNETFCIMNRISLKFVPTGPIDNKWALVWIMAWCRIIFLYAHVNLLMSVSYLIPNRKSLCLQNTNGVADNSKATGIAGYCDAQRFFSHWCDWSENIVKIADQTSWHFPVIHSWYSFLRLSQHVLLSWTHLWPTHPSLLQCHI